MSSNSTPKTKPVKRKLGTVLAHRIQLDPTEKQKRYFERACGTSRFVWNWALAEWNKQYAEGKKPNVQTLKKQFNTKKYTLFPWLGTIHKDAHARPFVNLGAAYSRFFKKTAKRPVFKKKGKCRDSFYIANDRITVTEYVVKLPIISWVRLTEELRISGKIVSAVVSREADRWFISVSVETDPPPLAEATSPGVGVDLGLTTFATLSDGTKTEAPKPLRKHLNRLRRLSRLHSRKQKGSQNKKKAALRLARLHRRIKNVRHDFLHKFTTKLCKTHAEVCVEDLNVRGMIKNHRLARSISDAGWGEFRRQLNYKAKLYGTVLTVRDRFFASSKTCSSCGYRLESLELSVRTWMCLSCSVVHDRDFNAAKNLLNPPKTTEGSSGSHACGQEGSGSSRKTGTKPRLDEAGTTKAKQDGC